MGLLNDAADLLDVSSSSPPSSLRDMANNTQGSDYSQSTGFSNLNPYMVWITGYDKNMAGDVDSSDGNGGIDIDGVLTERFSFPMSANWQPVLPAYTVDAASSALSAVAKGAGGLAGRTAGTGIGRATSALAGGISGIANGGKGVGLVGTVNQASQDLTGQSLNNPSWHQLIWQASSPVTFTLSMKFFTLGSPDSDVIQPIATLNKLMLPRYKDGVMRAPGYHPFNFDLNNPINTLGNDYRLDVYIGSTMAFHNVVVGNVQTQFNTTPSIVEGNKFHAAECQVTFLAQQVATKDDIDAYFQRADYSYTNDDPINSTPIIRELSNAIKGVSSGKTNNSLGGSTGSSLSGPHLG